MNIASLMVQVGADIRELENAMSKAQRSIQQTGQNFTQMGKTISTRVTAPLVALGGVAVAAFGKQEKAELQLRAALEANGRQVGDLFERYSAFASQMQKVSVIGDETTLAMLSQAESLGLTADSAERAVKNSVAMQSAFGVNAQSALRYTAALEQGNATMLTRYIPSLREIDDESERVAKAQEILGKAFSAAESEAEGTTGQLSQMKNAIGDMMEDIGEIISEAIMPFIRRIKELAEQFQNLEKEAKARIVAIAALFAAGGPLLIGLGLAAKAIAALISPIGLVVAAIAGLAAAIAFIWDNWKAVKERISDIGWWRNALVDMVQFFIDFNPFSLMIDGFNAMLRYFGQNEIPNPFTAVSESLEGLKGETQEYEHQFGSLTDAIINGVQRLTGFDISSPFKFKEAADDMDLAEQRNKEFGEGIERTGEKFVSLGSKARVNLEPIPERIKKVKDEAVNLGEALQASVTGAVSSFAETLGNAFTGDAGASGFFNNILMVVADFSRQLGQMLVAAGVASLAFKKLLLNPIAAIAAGGALIAAATAARNLLSEGPTTSVNDALIRSDGSIVKFHPDDNILAMKDFSGLQPSAQRVHVTVDGKIRGQDIHVSAARGGVSYER